MNNGNTMLGYNPFRDIAKVPYKILEALMTDTSPTAEAIWKLLRYDDVDALKKDPLTLAQKRAIIHNGKDKEQDYNVFLKPMVGDSLVDGASQVQLRLYRSELAPSDRYEAIACFTFDFLINDKSYLVEDVWSGILMERSDLLEELFLNLMNGRDLCVGSSYFEFNRELSRSCRSSILAGNNKTFYMRSITLATRFIGSEKSEDICG